MKRPNNILETKEYAEPYTFENDQESILFYAYLEQEKYIDYLQKQLLLCGVSNWVACKDRTPEKVGIYDVWQGEVFKAHWRDGVWKEVGGSKPTGYGGKLRREVNPTHWTIIKPPC